MRRDSVRAIISCVRKWQEKDPTVCFRVRDSDLMSVAELGILADAAEDKMFPEIKEEPASLMPGPIFYCDPEVDRLKKMLDAEHAMLLELQTRLDQMKIPREIKVKDELGSGVVSYDIPGSHIRTEIPPGHVSRGPIAPIVCMEFQQPTERMIEAGSATLHDFIVGHASLIGGTVHLPLGPTVDAIWRAMERAR